jgi:hypothetical protein
MGCGCNKRKKLADRASSYVLRMPDGSESTHGSRLEAEATNAKQGGGGKVAKK